MVGQPGSGTSQPASDTLDGARPGRPSFNAAALSPDGRVWFATGIVVQMVDRPSFRKKAEPAETYIESVIVDRKEFAEAETWSLRLIPATCRLITLRLLF